MKFNFNLFFLMMIFLSSLMLLSSNSWFNLWIWLEINLISFISFTINNKKKMSIESSLMYFLIQTISSIILLFAIMMLMFKNNMIMLLIFSLLIKLGSSPFHYWLPMMIEGLSWMKIFLLLTWQKINPLFMLMMNNYYMNLTLFIILSMIIGSISGLNYLSLKKIMSFSSISQLSWLMISLMNNKIMKIYLIMYIYLMWIIMKSFKMFNLNFINQIFNMKMKNKFIKLFIFMNLLSLGGLPPFLGFFPKLFVMIKLNNSIMMMFLVMFSLLSLFMYMRIMNSMMMLNSIKMNMMIKNNNYKKFLNMMKLSLINNLLLMFMFFMF